MKKQKEIFLFEEGNNWFKRNYNAILSKTENDEIIKYFLNYLNDGLKVLEIGSSNGWRLEMLRKSFPDSKFYGIDPSNEAISDGLLKYPNINLSIGTADELNF